VTDRKSVEQAVVDVLEMWGQIDVLVNNAGVIQVGPAELMTLADYETALQTHFWGPLYAMLAVIPAMRQRGAGRIANISSIGGKVSVPQLLPYSASKFALTRLSEGLRAELAKHGILVTTVIPGLMRTGSPRNAFFKGNRRAAYAWFSISDALPVVSMSAEKAARRILTACRYGDAEVILSLPAHLAVRIQGLCPGLTADALSLVNLLLPGHGDGGTQNVPGCECASAVSPSVLTSLSDEATERNNELAVNQVSRPEAASNAQVHNLDRRSPQPARNRPDGARPSRRAERQ
jgi:NAD(P)-dependent dehydrogenase (short-subunit alcohol dehydrogenase family)